MQTNGVITKRIAVMGLAGLLVYAISLTPTTSPAPSTPPPQPPQPVTVMNTTANPVPVVQQGAIAISGTPNVNVANNAASPVLVRSVDSGAAQPVQVWRQIKEPDGGSSLGGGFYQVPAGKRLVIEYISCSLFCPSDQQPSAELSCIDTAIPPNRIATMHMPLVENPVGVFSFGGLVKAYVEGGAGVNFNLSRVNPTGELNYGITMSGYLVDVP